MKAWQVTETPKARIDWTSKNGYFRAHVADLKQILTPKTAAWADDDTSEYEWRLTATAEDGEQFVATIYSAPRLRGVDYHPTMWHIGLKALSREEGQMKATIIKEWISNQLKQYVMNMKQEEWQQYCHRYDLDTEAMEYDRFNLENFTEDL